MEAMAIPFHMRYGSMICSKRLQSDRPHNLLNVLPLVPESPCGYVPSLDGEVGVADECDSGDGEADRRELGERDAVAVLGGEHGSQDQREETRAR